jgi:hypothetical protein
MGKSLLDLLTAGVTVAVGVFATLLAIFLTQGQTPGPWLKRSLIGLASVLVLLLACFSVAAGIEICGRWRTRKLTPLLSRGETLHEVALRIPRDNRTRVLALWREYEDWAHSVMSALPEGDRADFESLDRGEPPDPAAFIPLTDDQRYEVAGRVAVLRRIVKRLRGE